jgi:hypothetical protein
VTTLFVVPFDLVDDDRRRRVLAAAARMDLPVEYDDDGRRFRVICPDAMACYTFGLESGLTSEPIPDCLCRTRGCGHRASQHVGLGGACMVVGCACGPQGWS